MSEREPVSEGVPSFLGLGRTALRGAVVTAGACRRRHRGDRAHAAGADGPLCGVAAHVLGCGSGLRHSPVSVETVGPGPIPAASSCVLESGQLASPLRLTSWSDCDC